MRLDWPHWFLCNKFYLYARNRTPGLMLLIIIYISFVKKAWFTVEFTGSLIMRNRFINKVRIIFYFLKSICRIFCPVGTDSIPEHSVSDLWMVNTQGCVFLRELRLSSVSITPLVLHKHFIHLMPTLYIYIYIYSHGTRALGGPGPSQCRGFTITLRHTAVGRTPLDE